MTGSPVATRFLSLAEVLDLYERVLVAGGGSSAIRDLGALESALAQPRATFDDVELYSTLVDKAAALGFSLIRNHPFVDGNKRSALVVSLLFLRLNGKSIAASMEDRYLTFMALADGSLSEAELGAWFARHVLDAD